MAAERVNPENIVLRPIGIVRSPVTEIADDCWGDVVSTIELDPAQFTVDSTIGLPEYSHIEVVFYLSRIREENIVSGARCPRGRMDWPNVGIFAQRGKDRPNRIAVTVCRLLRVDGLKIQVCELDAIDGSPVLDLKPYYKGFAPRGEVHEPAWAAELMAGYFQKA